MRGCLVAVALVLAASVAGSQAVVYEWNFREGIGEWLTAHGAEPLTHENGAMVIRVSGPDPYIHCGPGHCLDIAANDRQFIRIRLRSTVAGGGSFYYADTTAGRDAGFVAEKHVGFPVEGDDAGHEIDVYPGWADRVTRLRLDPPGNDPGPVIQVERIAIHEWPESPQTGAVRDLTKDHGNWLPRGGATLAMTPQGLRIDGTQPVIGTRVGEPPADDPWLTLEGQADRDGLVLLSWTDPAGERRSLTQGFSVERSRHVFRLADGGGALGAGEELRVGFVFHEPPGGFVLRRTTLAETPSGPAMLDLLGAKLDRAAAAVGEQVTLELELQNSGGEPLPAGQVPAAAGIAAAVEHPALGPGERTAVRVSVTPSEPGTHTLKIGPVGASRTITLSVSETPGKAGSRGASVRRDTAYLAGETIRLRAGAAGEGRYGPLWLEIPSGDEWRRVAALPAIGLVMSGTSDRRVIDSADARAPGKGQTLLFSDTWQDGAGRAWTATAIYGIAGPGRIRVQHRLEVDQDAELYHFSGPWLRAGDGTSGGRKLEAIFPGLEYLGADVAEQEASSSDRDIRAPGDLRIVPDRHKITIPLQAVTLPNRDLVALLWRNDPDGAGPAAIFASPNFAEGGDSRLPGFALRSGENHLMGIFLPGAPEHVPENRIVAETPLPMKAGEPITIRSQILARADAEVLDAVRTWIEVYHPQRAGKVAGLLEQTLRLSADFYLKEYGRKQQDAAGIAVQCLYLAHLLDDPGLRELAEGAPGSTNNLSRALHIGGVADALWSQALSGKSALDSRTEEGTWVFQPDERRSVLGPRGDTNAGIIAPTLSQVLRSARATADEAMLEEALKSLEHLRKFRVPRGAQVWEVPLHCPDILASGRACDAFRLAYELTGDEQYLKDAQYWASTALPFIYHWQHPREDLKPMRGGSIPVFGASMFTNAWFGRLVQWNGMAVARSLHALSRAGGGEEWARVAEDLTVSGQRQQITDPENADYGRYPDYWNMRTGIPGYWLSPGLLLTVTLERAGYTPDGDWLILRSGGKLVSIVSPTPLKHPAAGRRLGRVATEVGEQFDLNFAVNYPLGKSSHVAVVGVSEPESVRIGGSSAERSDDLAGAASGWQYVEDFAALVLKIDHAQGAEVPVAIAGLRAQDAPEVVNRRVWEFRNGRDGWGVGLRDVRLELRDGKLVATATGGDPYFSGPRLALPSEEVERIRIRARATQAGAFQVFWANDDGGYAPERSIATAQLPADGAFHEVTAELAGHAEWKGTLRALRLDPPGGEGSVTEIEWIRLEP